MRRRWALALGSGTLMTVAAAWCWPAPGPEPAPPAELDEAPESPTPPHAVRSPTMGSKRPDAPGAFNLEVVSASDGQPLPGAQVYVGRTPEPARFHASHFSGRSGFNAETDLLGRVLVEPPRPLQVPEEDEEDEEEDEDHREEAGAPPAVPVLHLKVSHDHFSTYRGHFVPGMKVALEPRRPLRGRVVSASGAPVGGVVVAPLLLKRPQVSTAADGTFSIQLARADLLLAAQGDAVALSPLLDEARLQQDELLELVLAVPPHSEGRVVARDGQPLRDVEVTAALGHLSWTSRTGDDGLFRVPALEHFGLRLRLEKPGYVTQQTIFRETLTLPRASHLTGQLLDASGPVPGTRVALLSVDEDGEVELVAETHADAEGRFSFAGREELEVVVQSRRDDARVELQVKLREGDTTHVSLVFPPELEPVQLEFFSLGGARVSGCLATAAPVPPTGWSSRSSAYDDRIRLAPGRFDFLVRCRDERRAEETREVTPGTTTPLRFVVRSPDGGTHEDERPAELLRVRVTTPEGHPVEDAEVSCHQMKGTTDAAGRFTCEVRADDAWWPVPVRASKQGADAVVRATGRESEVVLVLRPRVTIHGRVEGALPEPPLFITVRSSEETSAQLLQGRNFQLKDRAAVRTFICVAVAPADASDERGCTISEAGEPVVVRADAAGEVSFIALDASGAPLAEPMVYLDRHARRVSAQAGAVRLALPPGEHVLILNVTDSRARYETRFVVRPGQLTELGALRLE